MLLRCRWGTSTKVSLSLPHRDRKMRKQSVCSGSAVRCWPQAQSLSRWPLGRKSWSSQSMRATRRKECPVGKKEHHLHPLPCLGLRRFPGSSSFLHRERRPPSSAVRPLFMERRMPTAASPFSASSGSSLLLAVFASRLCIGPAGHQVQQGARPGPGPPAGDLNPTGLTLSLRL